MNTEAAIKKYILKNIESLNIAWPLGRVPSIHKESSAEAATSIPLLIAASGSDSQQYVSRFLRFHSSSGSIEETDRKIVISMVKDGYRYSDIIRCITYSQSLSSASENYRWKYALNIVTSAANPALGLRHIERAIPIQQISRDSPPEEIYTSFLKHILTEDPSLSLPAADKKVIQLLTVNGFGKIKTISSLTSIPVYPLLEPMPPQLKEYRSKQLHNVIETEYLEQRGQTKQEARDADISAYSTLQQTLLRIKPTRQTACLDKYWHSTLIHIVDTVSSVTDQDILKNIMCIWAEALELAYSDFGIPKPENFRNLTANISSKSFFEVYETAAAAAELTMEFLKIPKHKVLCESSVLRAARPLKEVISSITATPEAIYYSALKEALAADSRLTPNEADIIAVLRMTSCDAGHDAIVQSLKYSPQFSKEDPELQIKKIKSFIYHAYQIQRHLAEEKEKSPAYRKEQQYCLSQ